MSKVTSSTKINASLEEVWNVVSDGHRLPDWLTPISTVRSVDDEGTLADGSTLKVKMVGRVPPGQRVAVKEAEPGQKMSLAVGPAFAHALGIAMRADLNLKPADGGTLATVDFACHPITGPLQRRISGMNLVKHVRSTARQLKAAAEAASRHRN
jgi:uncharacterized protein YndB with AHSA1/START domain